MTKALDAAVTDNHNREIARLTAQRDRLREAFKDCHARWESVGMRGHLPIDWGEVEHQYALEPGDITSS